MTIMCRKVVTIGGLMTISLCEKFFSCVMDIESVFALFVCCWSRRGSSGSCGRGCGAEELLGRTPWTFCRVGLCYYMSYLYEVETLR